MEKRKRSLVKTISWRITASITTMILTYFFTRNVVITVGIGSTEAVAKFLIYYLHERIWNKISIGRN